IESKIEAVFLLIDNHSIELNFKSLVFRFSHIPVLGGVTCAGNREFNQKVFGIIAVQFNATVYPALEQTEIKPQVPGKGCLPLQVGIGHSGRWCPEAEESVYP